jgi:hypothetical protein
VRQWVISVPKRLRGMLADRPRAVAALTKIFLTEIERLLCAAAGVPEAANTPSASRPRLGGISFLHRFGSALNNHVHLHACVTDGVFVPAEPQAAKSRHGAGHREHRQAVRRRCRQAWGRRSRHARLLRHAGKAPVARHLPDCVGETHGPGGGGAPLECPACSGDIRLIAFITEPGPIRKILTHVLSREYWRHVDPLASARGFRDSAHERVFNHQ